MPDKTPSDGKKKRPRLSTAEELSSGNIHQFRKIQKESSDARTSKASRNVHPLYFPEQYKRAMMEVLIEYRDFLDANAKSRGTRRNVGWHRMASHILRALNDDNSNDPKKLKSLSNSFHAHENGTAIMADRAFVYVDKFLRSLDGTAEYDRIRSKLAKAKRTYLRDAFFEMFGRRNAKDEHEIAYKHLQRQFFQYSSKDSAVPVTTVIGFDFQDDRIFDVILFSFLGRLEDHAARESVRGVFVSYGFGVVENGEDAIYIDDTIPQGERPNRISLLATFICSSVFDTGIGFSGITAATIYARDLFHWQQKRVFQEITLLKAPLPEQRAFVSISENAIHERPEENALLYRFLEELGYQGPQFASSFSLVQRQDHVAYLSGLKEKFDGAI